ncbi:MAG: DUF1992 domain-containing protein [Chloroflexi bacterium]|nr:DUF1992 domain-containing protein [Chloroflexota bacterium]
MNAEEQIRRAMEEGQFDNLPGKGQPLKLEDNPFADPEWSLAHDALRKGGFTLPWIETRREIEAELAEARAALRGAWEWRQSAAQDYAPHFIQGEWQRARRQFEQRIAAINRRIAAYNLEAPLAQLQRLPVQAERELEAYGASLLP